MQPDADFRLRIAQPDGTLQGKVAGPKTSRLKASRNRLIMSEEFSGCCIR